jgi:hypothetical protein
MFARLWIQSNHLSAEGLGGVPFPLWGLDSVSVSVDKICLCFYDKIIERICLHLTELAYSQT